MHPAPSIIFFTTASGAGYGFLFLLGLMGVVTPLDKAAQPSLTLAAAATVGALLVVAGLVSSTFHLRHPERAWRALTQWRSSWLSREGVAAMLTFIPVAGFLAAAFGLVSVSNVALFGPLMAFGAVVTVACTGMIYASLKTIRQWHNPLVLPLYLGFAVATGAQIMAFIFALGGEGEASKAMLGALLLTAAVWVLKALYWARFDPRAVGTRASALALPEGAEASLLFEPHTEENYLLRELAYRIGRKHSRKLRGLALLFGAALAMAGMAIGLAVPGLWAALPAGIGAVCGLVGVLIERWLFFAEATHAVTHYYR